MQPLECHGFRGEALISQTGAGIGCDSQDRFELGRFACFLSRHVCARRDFELLDCKFGPWRLLSEQTFPDGIALVAVAGACWQVMARRWCRLSPDQRLHRGPIPCLAHWMDHPSACCSHRQAGQAEPEWLLSMGARHSLADAAAALGSVPYVSLGRNDRCGRVGSD